MSKIKSPKTYWAMPLGMAALFGLSTGLVRVLSKSTNVNRALDSVGNAITHSSVVHVVVRGFEILLRFMAISVGGTAFFALVFLGGAFIVQWLPRAMRVYQARRQAKTFLKSKGHSFSPSGFRALLSNPDLETRKAATWIALKGIKKREKEGTLTLLEFVSSVVALVRDQDPAVAAEGAEILEALGTLGKCGKSALFDRLAEGLPELQKPILEALRWIGVDRQDRAAIGRVITASANWTKHQQDSVKHLKHYLDEVPKKRHSEIRHPLAYSFLVIVAVFFVIGSLIAFVVNVVVPFLSGRWFR